MFRVLDIYMWNDPIFNEQDLTTKLLFIYLITSPHSHFSGIYYLRISTIADEMGISPQVINRSLKNLMNREEKEGAWHDNCLIEYDFERHVVWVKNMLKHQMRNNRNYLKSAVSHLNDIPKTPLIKRFLGWYASCLEEYNVDVPSELIDVDRTKKCANANCSIPDISGIDPPLIRDLPCGEKEKEKEKEKDKRKRDMSTSVGAGAVDNSGVVIGSADEFLSLWNEHCKKLPKASMTAKRRTEISARLRENKNPQYWARVFATIANSKFCNGENDRSWRANFDFAVKRDRHIKVLEGVYGGLDDLAEPLQMPECEKFISKGIGNYFICSRQGNGCPLSYQPECRLREIEQRKLAELQKGKDNTA